MMHTQKSYYQFLYFKLWCFIILKLSSIQFKQTIIDYIKESLSWRVHYKNGVTVTAGSTQLSLRRVFATLDIGSFFPKVNKSIDEDFVNNEFEGFLLNDGYEMTG